MVNLSPWNSSIQNYEMWLENTGPRAVKRWRRGINSSDEAAVEGAIAEAVAWDFLRCRVDTITLADDPSTGGPDFLCHVGAKRFFVEVTNMTRDSVTEHTGLIENQHGPRWYALLTAQVDRKVTKKAGKSSDLGAPLLLVLTTLHFDASHACVCQDSIACLLTSDTGISSIYDPTTGEAVGDEFQSTDLRYAVFVEPPLILDSNGNPVFRVVRRNISAVVVCGFGLMPPDMRAFGALHPDPVHVFEPAWLSDVPFCKYAQWPLSESFAVAWLPTSKSARNGL